MSVWANSSSYPPPINKNYLILGRGFAILLKQEDRKGSDELKDYKMMCFNGKVFCTYVCSERATRGGLRITFYDRDWKRMPLKRASHPTAKQDTPKPEQYERMISLAETLAKDLPFARVDFYNVDGHLYFGEITIYPAGGFEQFKPSAWDKTFGEMIKLPL